MCVARGAFGCRERGVKKVVTRVLSLRVRANRTSEVWVRRPLECARGTNPVQQHGAIVAITMMHLCSILALLNVSLMWIEGTPRSSRFVSVALRCVARVALCARVASHLVSVRFGSLRCVALRCVALRCVLLACGSKGVSLVRSRFLVPLRRLERIRRGRVVAPRTAAAGLPSRAAAPRSERATTDRRRVLPGTRGGSPLRGRAHTLRAPCAHLARTLRRVGASRGTERALSFRTAIRPRYSLRGSCGRHPSLRPPSLSNAHTSHPPAAERARESCGARARCTPSISTGCRRVARALRRSYSFAPGRWARGVADDRSPRVRSRRLCGGRLCARGSRA